MRFVLKRKSPVWLVAIAIIPIGFFGLGNSIGSNLSPRRAFILATAASMIGVLGAGMNLLVVGRPWTVSERVVAIVLGDAVAIGAVVVVAVVLHAIWS